MIESEGRRSMPIGGKALELALKKGEGPGEQGKTICLELLLRLMQRTEKELWQRSKGDHSLLLLQLPMESMQEKLPRIKSEWIAKGDFSSLIEQLKEISDIIWSLSFKKYEGLNFNLLCEKK